MTVVALVQDEHVRAQFEQVVYVSLGQTPAIVDLQRSVHEQLCNRPMEQVAAEASDERIQRLLH